MQLQIPQFDIELKRSRWEEWIHFRQHHYKTKNLQSDATCFIGIIRGTPIRVGIAALAVFVGYTGFQEQKPTDKVLTGQRHRESRLVVLPEFQGFGIGSRFSDALGELCRIGNMNYSAKTAHTSFASYRNRSPLWVPQTGSGKPVKNKWEDFSRIFFTHRYVGKLDEECKKFINGRVIVHGTLENQEKKNNVESK